MQTNDAIRQALNRSGKSARGVSLECGHYATWLSSTLGRDGAAGAPLVASVASATGYVLAMVPIAETLPPGSIEIDAR